MIFDKEVVLYGNIYNSILWSNFASFMTLNFVIVGYILIFTYYKHLKQVRHENGGGGNKRNVRLDEGQFTVQEISRKRIQG